MTALAQPPSSLLDIGDDVMQVGGQVARVLTEHGVDHGPLVYLGRESNHLYSDRSGVFVKLAPDLDRGPFEREMAARRVPSVHAVATTSLHAEVLEVGGRAMVAFGLRPHRSRDALCLNTSVTWHGAARLATVHLSKQHAGAEPMWGRFIRASQAQIHGLAEAAICPSRLLDDLGTAVARWVETLPVDVPRSASFGLVHGDAHCGNMLVTEDDRFDCWGDFEDFGLAPKEWDIAVMRTSLLLTGRLMPNRAAWFTARHAFESAYAVDWALVDRLALARLTRLACWRASRLDFVGAATLLTRLG